MVRSSSSVLPHQHNNPAEMNYRSISEDTALEEDRLSQTAMSFLHLPQTTNRPQENHTQRKQVSATAKSTNSTYRSQAPNYTKQDQAACLLICISFFFYLWLLRHSPSPSTPETPVPSLRSTATPMNYANPLVLFRVP